LNTDLSQRSFGPALERWRRGEKDYDLVLGVRHLLSRLRMDKAAIKSRPKIVFREFMLGFVLVDEQAVPL
jgi:hypothetical protein